MPAVCAHDRAYYTPERLATANTNLANHSWAQAQWHRINHGDGVPDYFIGFKYADLTTFSTQSDDFFWFLQPDTVIPRFVPESSAQISPTTGLKLSQEFGFKAWSVDPIGHPFKVQDRSTGEWYPKNDFHQYYLHGIDSSGRFSAAQANNFPDYLKNEEDGSGFYVDRNNGEGFLMTPDNPNTPDVVEDHEYRVYPIRLYSKFVYTAYTVPLLCSLSQAALLETDPIRKSRCAYQGLILLARLAFIYPDYRNPTSPTGRASWTYEAVYGAPKNGGMIADPIWESSAFEQICLAYDALRPFLYTDPDIVNFLYLKGVPAMTPSALDDYIRKWLLQAGMDALQQRKIRGNIGMAEAAAMSAAVVFNDLSASSFPNSKSLADFVFRGYYGLNYLVTNTLHRDGGGHESVNYCGLKLDLIRANKLMDRLRQMFPSQFSSGDYLDVFSSDKARALFDFFIDVAPQDRFVPAFGDSGSIRVPKAVDIAQYLPGREFFYAWEKFEKNPDDPSKPSRYLKAAGISGVWPAGDLFESYPGAAALAANGPTGPEHVPPWSRLLDGYGVGILEQGWGNSRRTLLQNATALIGHRQFDPLSLELYAKNVSLLPDLGYPVTWNYCWQFDGHSLAANTVTVDETRGTMGSLLTETGNTFSLGPTGAIGRLFGGVGPLQVVANSFNPYPAGYHTEPFRTRFERIDDPVLAETAAKNVTLYERMDLMVEMDSERSYIVDLFSVNGGSQHDLSWHGPLVVPSDPPSSVLQLTPQSGTLAGPGIARFSEYTDNWGRWNHGGTFASCLASLRTGILSVPASWEWRTALAGQDGVRIFLLPVGGNLQIIRGLARSIARKDEVEYLLARKSVSDGSRTRFLSIVEPFVAVSKIQNVALVSSDPLVVEVRHTGGTDRISLASPDASALSTQNRGLGARLERWLPGQSGANKCIDVQYGAVPSGSPGYTTTPITAVNYGEKAVRIAYTEEHDAAFQVGRWIRIHNSSRSSMYRIVGRSFVSGITLTLDRTALLARGPVLGVTGSRVELGTDLFFANGGVGPSGNLTLAPWQPRDFFAGAWMSEGANAKSLKGGAKARLNSGERSSYLYFSSPVSAPGTLETALGSGDVEIWDYGVGDTVEVAVAGYHQQIPPGGSRAYPVHWDPDSHGSNAVVEVMAWVKAPTWQGFTKCLKVTWDGVPLTASMRPASFTTQSGITITTFHNTHGYLLPYLPDPISISPTSHYYFRNQAEVFNLTKLRFPISAPASGNHTLVLSHTQAGITSPIIVGSVSIVPSP